MQNFTPTPTEGKPTPNPTDEISVADAWESLNELHADHDAVRVLLQIVDRELHSVYDADNALADRLTVLFQAVEARTRTADLRVDRLFDLHTDAPDEAPIPPVDGNAAKNLAPAVCQ